VLDEGSRSDGLKTDEREELVRLQRENARLKEEREILSKAAAGFAQETEKKSKESSRS
jgi:transposase